MDNLITNIRIGASHEPPPHGPWSRVVLESTIPLTPVIAGGGAEGGGIANAGAFAVRVPGVRLNMPDCIIPVHDGLVATVSASSRGELTLLEILLEHAAPVSIRLDEGMPYQLEIRFDSRGAYSVLKDRTLAIDPGHGGRDAGGRGPVNLVEKGVTLNLAEYLRRLCSSLSIPHYLTRDSDVAMPLRSRVTRALARSADAIISIHTGIERNRDIRGTRVQYANPNGREMAGFVLVEIARKLNLPDRGVSSVETSAGRNPFARLHVPAIEVEFVTLSNPVDEGLVRSSTFMHRAALAILNGIKNYYWHSAGD